MERMEGADMGDLQWPTKMLITPGRVIALAGDRPIVFEIRETGPDDTRNDEHGQGLAVLAVVCQECDRAITTFHIPTQVPTTVMELASDMLRHDVIHHGRSLSAAPDEVTTRG